MVRGLASGGVYYLVLDRAERLNSLDSPTLEEATRLVGEACRGDYGVIVVTGEGRFFSAGMDLGEIASASDPGEVRALFERFTRFLEALVSCRGSSGYWKPVVAVLNGPAVAGGAEIALATDAVVAVGKGYLQWPELRWGLVPPMLAGLAGRLGLARIAWAGLAMERIGFEEAYRLGLVSVLAESVDEAKSIVEGVAKSATANPRAVHALLDPVRRVKAEWVRGASSLVDLAGRRELIEAARRFLGRG